MQQTTADVQGSPAAKSHGAREARVCVADVLGPLIERLAGHVRVRFEFWDGSACGPVDAPATVWLRSVDAMQRVLWSPGELGVGRAFVVGDIEVDGDLYEILRALRPAAPRLRAGLRSLPRIAAAARQLGAVGRPLPPPDEEVRPRGVRHSIARDAAAVGHHYDVGNDFYRIVLGPAMTYSCARFTGPDMSLTDAQAPKHDLVCRKLGVHERSGMALLDVGCGWGAMAMHAAERYGARVVGVTDKP